MRPMRKGHIIGISILIAIMIGITLFSSQTARESDSISKGIVKHVAIKLKLITEEQANGSHYKTITEWNHMLRKATHFAIYFMLAFIAFRVIYMMNQRVGLSAVLAWLLTIAFASIDEYHQTFVAGRGGQVSDVILDSAGGLTAIIMSVIIMKLNKKKQPR